MLYTVGEMAKRLGIAASTLRYYDQEGLLPFVERSSGGIRMFKEADYEWLRVIQCLKATGMPLKDIRAFVLMALEGDETIDARLELIAQQRDAVLNQMDALQQTLEILNFKIWYYETAKTHGTTVHLKNLSLEDIPPEHRTARVRLKGIEAHASEQT